MKILVVDDNPHIIDVFQCFLDTKGISYKIFNEGKQGLEEIKRQEYGIVFLDIAMPGYNGFDFLSELKSQNIECKNIVILTASNIQHNDLDDFQSVGMKEVLTKPVSLYKIEVIEEIKSVST
jgi:two-component system, OmpR family, response regulator